jgi:hypothetical protein
MAPAGWSTAAGGDPLVGANDALKVAADYRGGGFSDWRLPSAYEIEFVCRFATGQLKSTVSSCVESTTRIDPNFGDGTGNRLASYYWYGDAPVSMQLDFASARRSRSYEPTARVRPVREWTFTTATTTSALPKRCDQGGVCSIGDVSPTGGLIIDFSVRNGRATYTEIARSDWYESIKPLNWSGPRTDPAFTKTAAVSNVNAYGSAQGTVVFREQSHFRPRLCRAFQLVADADGCAGCVPNAERFLLDRCDEQDLEIRQLQLRDGCRLLRRCFERAAQRSPVR